MLSLKLFITISFLQLLASAAPIIPRQGGPIELLPVKGGGSGILNTSVGPLNSGTYTELQGLTIGERNAQELQEELESVRVGPGLNGQIYTELQGGETVVFGNEERV